MSQPNPYLSQLLQQQHSPTVCTAPSRPPNSIVQPTHLEQIFQQIPVVIDYHLTTYPLLAPYIQFPLQYLEAMLTVLNNNILIHSRLQVGLHPTPQDLTNHRHPYEELWQYMHGRIHRYIERSSIPRPSRCKRPSPYGGQSR